MRARVLRLVAWRGPERTALHIAAVVIAVVSIAPVVVAGQPAGSVKKAAPAGGIPRMPDGQPNLQGTYDIGTLTPLQRRAGSPLVMTGDEAKKLEQQVAARSDNLNAPIDANRAAPPTGGDGSPGPYGNVGGYNNFWLDPGTHYTTVDGQKRASLLIDPPDGRLPELTPDGKTRQSSRQARPTSDQAAREEDPGFEGADAYNDPEMRPLAERCLLGFSSTSGPPMLPTYFYNNLHQIVQTPDKVMILTEMVHDARIVRIGGTHLPPTMKRWLGDSIGHWEGDTLVVETTNFTDNTRFMGSTEALRVVERFTRVDARTLRYQFTIDDPKTWTRPWTAEYTWPATDDLMYEYACHEGNYALGNILRGARLKEKTDATKSRQQ
jgi:hypothetical protein